MNSRHSPFPTILACAWLNPASGPTDTESWLCKNLVWLIALLFNLLYSLDSSEGSQSPFPQEIIRLVAILNPPLSVSLSHLQSLALRQLSSMLRTTSVVLPSKALGLKDALNTYHTFWYLQDHILTLGTQLMLACPLLQAHTANKSISPHPEDYWTSGAFVSKGSS